MKLVNILIVKANIFHKMFNFNNDISDLLFKSGVFPWDKKFIGILDALKKLQFMK